MTQGSVLFRPQRGTLAESMAEVREVADRAALVAHLAEALAGEGIEITDATVRVEPYRRDKRTGWDTHLVIVEGWGPVGFASAPL